VPKTLSGNIDTFSLADLLQWLEINGLSGRVTIQRGDVRRAIDLKGGAIVFVSSSRPDERLGVFLASRSVLPEPVIYELLAENFATGKALTRLIVDRQLLSRERLAEAVESLAIQVLLDLFHWSGAVFEFDPMVRTEDILRIQLSLRGQVLAFHGVKSVDDSARIRISERTDPDIAAPWEREFSPDVLAATFWTLLERSGSEHHGADGIRERFYVFSRFAEQLKKRLSEQFRLFPIFDDTALLLQAAIEEEAGTDHLVQIAALDPFLTLDLLYLANALRIERKGLAATAREAAVMVGDGALRLFLRHLSSQGAVKTSSADKLERVIRRSALSTAVAASQLSEPLGLSPELGYTLGLIEPLAAYEPLKILLAADFEPGPFRANVLDEFRSLHGRVLARKLNLPRPHADVFGSLSEVTSRSPVAEQLIFFAKKLLPAERIGCEVTSEDPELADRFVTLTADSDLPALVAEGTARLKELVNL
jgi:hypothetical protein